MDTDLFDLRCLFIVHELRPFCAELSMPGYLEPIDTDCCRYLRGRTSLPESADLYFLSSLGQQRAEPLPDCLSVHINGHGRIEYFPEAYRFPSLPGLITTDSAWKHCSEYWVKVHGTRDFSQLANEVIRSKGSFVVGVMCGLQWIGSLRIADGEELWRLTVFSRDEKVPFRGEIFNLDYEREIGRIEVVV